MRFVIPSKTFAALLGTSLFIASSPSEVFARNVDPSDILEQVTESGTLSYGSETKNDCYAKGVTNWEGFNRCAFECDGSAAAGSPAHKDCIGNCGRTNGSPISGLNCDVMFCISDCEQDSQDTGNWDNFVSCEDKCDCQGLCWGDAAVADQTQVVDDYNECVADNKCSGNSPEAIQTSNE